MHVGDFISQLIIFVSLKFNISEHEQISMQRLRKQKLQGGRGDLNNVIKFTKTHLAVEQSTTPTVY
jgi:hypothetical protein